MSEAGPWATLGGPGRGVRSLMAAGRLGRCATCEVSAGVFTGPGAPSTKIPEEESQPAGLREGQALPPGVSCLAAFPGTLGCRVPNLKGGTRFCSRGRYPPTS